MNPLLSGLAVLAWFVGSLLLGLGVGRIVDARDEQVPS